MAPTATSSTTGRDGGNRYIDGVELHLELKHPTPKPFGEDYRLLPRAVVKGEGYEPDRVDFGPKHHHRKQKG